MTDRGKLPRFKLKQKLFFKLATAPFLCFILSKINVVTTGQVTVGQMTMGQNTCWPNDNWSKCLLVKMPIGKNAYW